MTQNGVCEDVVQRVAELTQKANPKVVELRRDIHAHPELSNREERTARVVAETLASLKVDKLKTGVARHGVVALIQGNSAGPTVGLRADMDALPITEETGLPFASQNPGIMHACGHDAHTAILLGTADVLSQMRDHIRGAVKLIFQPAEEGAPPGEEGGAKLMLKEGVLHDPDVSAIFGLHVFPDVEVSKLGYNFGGTMASVDRFRVKVQGKQVHAAYPWEGIDPIVASAHIITGLQTIVSRMIDTTEPAGVVSVGMIQGGMRWNIIPEAVQLEGTIRTHKEQVRRQVLEAFTRIIHRTAEAHQATAEIVNEVLSPVLSNNAELVRRSQPPLEHAAGEGNIVEAKPSMAGDDFAFFAQAVPGFYIRLGVRNELLGAVYPLHTPRFLLDENALPLGIRLLSLLALEYTVS